MKNTLLNAVVLVLLIGSTQVIASESKPIQKNAVASKKWEVGLTINGFIEGSDGDNAQSTGGGGLRAGYRFEPAWSVIGEFLYTSHFSFRETNDKTDIYRGILSLNWDAWPKDYYTPYATVGVGYESFPEIAAKRNGALATIGGGIRYNYAENYGINAEIKYKINVEHQDVTVFLTVGFNYRFSTDERFMLKR